MTHALWEGVLACWRSCLFFSCIGFIVYACDPKNETGRVSSAASRPSIVTLQLAQLPRGDEGGKGPPDIPGPGKEGECRVAVEGDGGGRPSLLINAWYGSSL